jgi:hypothetical protein
MHFDHGDTAEKFPRQYHTGRLLSTLRERLLNPAPLIGWDLNEVHGCHCSV